jgi:hypothetical protein
MPDVDPNAVAAAAITDLQTAIDSLSAMPQTPAITQQINNLQSKQTALQTQALRTIEDSPANQAAIKTMNDAAAALNAEAGNITSVATALTTAAKVVSAAASLITALAPFI